MEKTVKTKLTAVFGYPLRHTLSPLLHNAFYEQHNINAVMLAFANPDIKKLIEAMRTLPIYLAAVTIPHKQTIMPYLDEVDAAARVIGAVNTVINREGRLVGYNTDVIGIVGALAGVNLKDKKVLILGAGGVARAAAYHLKNAGAKLFCWNRSLGAAQSLMRELGGEVAPALEMLGQAIDIIVNATPVGMYPKTDESPFPFELIQKHQVILDLIYNPAETRLLSDARRAGATVINGIKMFVAQALAQEALWLRIENGAAKYESLLVDYQRK